MTLKPGEMHEEITKEVLGACFDVHNSLGAGFLEKVYERAVIVALEERGVEAQAQVRFPVLFHGKPVGDYFADLVVAGAVVVELKSCEMLGDAHRAQSYNYLRASGLKVCLLVNFGRPRLEWERVLHG